MDFQVVWTDPALADLQEVVVYISKDDPVAAERVGNGIVDHVETLRTFSAHRADLSSRFAWQYSRDRIWKLPDILPGVRGTKARGSSHNLARRPREPANLDSLILASVSGRGSSH
jgi:plasmid stabilization system protein ParE